MSAYSEAQQKAYALMPKFSGFTSMCCSSLIVYAVLRDKKKRAKSYHRLLCGVSIVDAIVSFFMALSTWPIPKAAWSMWSAGNETTCNLQAFFVQFGFASPFYNASLSFFYLLIVRYGWEEERIKRIEPWLHGIPILWGLGSATAGLIAGVYGNNFIMCGIAQQYKVALLVMVYVPLWTMIAVVTVTCILLYVHVRKLEHKLRRYRFVDRERLMSQGRSSNTPPTSDQSPGVEKVEAPARRPRREIRRSSAAGRTSRGRSRDVARQSFWYAGAFYFIWLPISLVEVLVLADRSVPFPLLLFAVTVLPILGLPNFLVYSCPKFRELRREYPRAGVWRWLCGTLAPSSSRSVDEEVAGDEIVNSMEDGQAQADRSKDSSTHRMGSCSKMSETEAHDDTSLHRVDISSHHDEIQSFDECKPVDEVETKNTEP